MILIERKCVISSVYRRRYYHIFSALTSRRVLLAVLTGWFVRGRELEVLPNSMGFSADSLFPPATSARNVFQKMETTFLKHVSESSGMHRTMYSHE